MCRRRGAAFGFCADSPDSRFPFAATPTANALRQAPESARPARWYYYAAIASQGLGNNIDALNYAKRASDMEPGNPDYMNLVRRLQSGGTWYQSRGESYGGIGPMNPQATWCLSMCALNLLCNCCAGGRFYF